MTLRVKYIEKRKERQFNYFKLALFSVLLTLFSINIFAQDSIPEKEDLTEAAELKFQQFFFKALSEKAIGNHQKAIENLENCNQILPDDNVVFFEFSKNYLNLNNLLLAKEYIQRALSNDVDNIWMLKHLVKIYQKENDLKEAIKIQQKVVALNPKEREFLVRLYLYNRDYEKATSLMNVLQNEQALPSNLKSLKNRLENRKTPETKELKLTDISNLEDQFKTNKSYKILEQILKISENNADVLFKYSEEGIKLFPAQPYVYLMKGKALNYQKKYKNALTILESGIDFVIDDKMELDFYKEISKSYGGLGNVKEENRYKQKANKLKS